MELITFEKKNGVATITLNRPQVYNSFNIQMGREVQAALADCEVDKQVRAIVLTATGKGFCAGQDLKEATAPNAPTIGELVDIIYNPIVNKLRSIEKPIIGAVNGVAAGAGANIALACDITFVAKSAKFIQSFTSIGLIPDSGGSFFLPRLVGMQRATAQLFLADDLSADEAKDLGMIYDVVEGDELMETATKFAEKLAKRPTKGLGLTKRALNQSLSNSLTEQLMVERTLQAEAGETHDHKEGIQAFFEKRKPVFKGE